MQHKSIVGIHAVYAALLKQRVRLLQIENLFNIKHLFNLSLH